jgi:hypothetical protein
LTYAHQNKGKTQIAQALQALAAPQLLLNMKAKEEEDKKIRDNVESMMKLNLRGLSI